MAHQALYRRWRPQRFSDVVGQPYAVQTLKNAIAQGEIAHAYLFAGPRGTGKTSVARILAKAINCPNPQGGEPCNACPLCEAIARGNALDVVEIDGASNRGIDQIRQLREEVAFRPAEARYKVYIIDEVHMLTNEAFNALLKTLEEPPPHVVFVFATTEPHKVPPTVLSRCQAFEFKAIPQERIESHLRAVARAEKIRVDEEALRAIARHARGALRDALVLLEQLVAYKGGEPITAQDLHEVLGLPPQETLDRFLEALLNKNGPEALEIVEELAERGRDLELFVSEAIHRGRDRLVAALREGGDASTPSPSARAWAALLGQLLELKRELRLAFDKRVVLEVKALEIAGAEGPPAAAATAATAAPAAPEAPEAPEALEPARPAPHTTASASAPASMSTSTPPPADADKPAAPPAPARPQAQATPDVERDLDLEGRWAELLKRARRKKAALYALLAEARPRLEGRTLVVEYAPRFGFHKERLEQPQHFELLKQLVHEVFGPETGLRVGFADSDSDSTTPQASAQAQDERLKEKAEMVRRVMGGGPRARGL